MILPGSVLSCVTRGKCLILQQQVLHWEKKGAGAYDPSLGVLSAQSSHEVYDILPFSLHPQSCLVLRSVCRMKWEQFTGQTSLQPALMPVIPGRGLSWLLIIAQDWKSKTYYRWPQSPFCVLLHGNHVCFSGLLWAVSIGSSRT